MRSKAAAAEHPETQSARADSREKLLLAAERLLGKHGINGVSLREIARAAGHRNVAAIQYHFGSRQGLIDAIFDKRMRTLEIRRNEMLDEIEAASLSDDLYAIAWTIFWPIAELMMREKDGANYARFVTEMFQTPEYNVEGMIDGRLKHGTVRAFTMMETVLAGRVEKAVFRRRFPMIIHSGFYALTDIDAVRQRSEAAGQAFDFERAVLTLLDMLVAAISAPVNQKSIEKLHEIASLAKPERKGP